ncbi:hypothetical protein [Roseomonas chloroacetimidivorans]|uniref:hypothetical protein n=1 Tax=Roseomonas chloroacetimidivorans TaxID=1766656 RepID=UPI003C72FDE6
MELHAATKKEGEAILAPALADSAVKNAIAKAKQRGRHCHVVWGPSKFDREAEFA